MYKQFSKAEIAVMGSSLIAAMIYRILEDSKVHIIPSEAMLIVWVLTMGYIFFNRGIKWLFNLIKNRHNFYSTTAEITDIKDAYFLDTRYDCYILKYNYNDKPCTKEIHISFSITKWHIGDKIKIKINRNSPDNIIIVFSDLATAIIMSIIGFIFVAVPIAVFIKTRL